MDAACEFAGERPVDHAMAFDAALAAERLRHDRDPEMRFSARPVTGVAHVMVRFVDHIQVLRRERCAELRGDDIPERHRGWVRERRGRVNPATTGNRICQDLKVSSPTLHNVRS